MPASRCRSTNGTSRPSAGYTSATRADVTTRDYNAEYKDGASQYAYTFDSLLRRYMMRTLDPLLPGGKALEMGCYTGDVTEMLAERYDDLTVIEASEELVDATRARLGTRAKFLHGMFETIDLRERYDAVFLMHTLEHLDDPVFVLGRVNGWLSDRGRLFVVVPNANAPSRQIAVQMGLIPFNDAVTDAERAHGHRKTYRLDTLQRTVLDAGLRVVQSGGVFFKPLANYQFDKLLGGDVISDGYLEGCYRLGMHYPDLCASIYAVCERVAPNA
jgi:2-polyprenyl-3-methyl-5-hydroxy-6-metoxy-1,4-benzoquinol methylase